MSDIEFIINNRYEYLINNPIPINNSLKTTIIKEIYYKNDTPYSSIVIPVFNQENIIVENLQSIINTTKELSYELIIIIDACTDNTEFNIINWINALEVPYNLYSILIIKNNIPIYETACDNIGFICARGKYIIEIQSDMKMTEDGYNIQLLKPFNIIPELIGVSGRCGHGIMQSYGIGKLGELINETLSHNILRNKIYITESCVRGPLVLDREKLQQLGFLDEMNFFLDNSDHDLFMRAYVQYGWICGYVPIEFSAPLINGSTRKERIGINKYIYDLYQERTKNGIGGFLNKYITLNFPYRDIVAYDI